MCGSEKELAAVVRGECTGGAVNKYSQRACAREKGIRVGVRAQIRITNQ